MKPASLTTDHSPSRFYVTGGTLSREALSYVVRQADDDLYNGLCEGKFCYVLTSRQMGKSSLMVRTAARLREAGFGVIILDLTAIGQNLSAEQWYGGLLTQIGQQLDLEDELEEFWETHPRLGPLYRWMQSIRQVLLRKYPGPVVIFIDEIDAVRSLPFSTDEFFAAIREFYNRRAEDEKLERLTFCLLGVAAPSDLIRDTRTTPFNVGRRIELHDFTEAEAAPLAEGLRQAKDAGARLLSRIRYWTNGHPYLTQRLCQEVAEEARSATTDEVDRICRVLFLSHQALERDDNLLFVRERILRSETDLAGLLTLYQKVLANKRVPDEATNPLFTVLRLSGAIRVENNFLEVRNRIYEQAFGLAWVKENMPDAELRRQRDAYRRGLLRATAIYALIIAAIAGLAFVALWQRKRAERQEQSNRRLLYSAHMNLASRDWRDSNIEHMRDLLALHMPITGQEDLRGFEWYLLWSLAYQDRQTIPLPGPVEFLAFSRDLKTFAIGKETGVQLWDVAQAKLSSTLDGVGINGAVQFSPDGRVLATSSSDNSIRLWDLSERHERARLTGHTKPLVALLFSHDGQMLASTSEDQTARLWEIATGNLRATLSGHTGSVDCIAFSPDGKRVLTGGDDETVRVWDTETGKELLKLKEHPAKGLSSTASVWRVQFSPDGSRVLAVGNFVNIAVWDAKTGNALPAIEGHQSWIQGLAFSPDGKLLASGSGDRTIRIWDVTKWTIVKSLAGHGNQVVDLVFSEDSKSLASVSGDNTIKIWDMDAPSNPLLLPGYRVAFSKDGKNAVSAGRGGLQLWDVATWKAIATFAHPGPINTLAYCSDGKSVATGSDDGTARLWDIATGKERWTLEANMGSVRGVNFSPDAKLLATASDDRIVRIWEVTSGQEIAKLAGHSGAVHGVAFSPNGRLLASSSWDATIKLWDVASRKELATLRSGSSEFEKVAFSPDGSLLASSGLDSKVRLWDVASRRELFTLKGHAGNIFGLDFSPDGKRIASGGQDFTLRLWDVASGTEMLTLQRHRAPILSVAFSPDGASVLTSGGDGVLRVWRAARENEVRSRSARRD